MKRNLVRAARAYLIVLMAGVGIAAILLAVAIARPKTFWTPDGADLGRSVERSGEGFTIAYPGCARSKADLWTCEIETDVGSGGSGDVYRVRLEPDNCWRATRDGDASDAPRRLDGCVDSVRDFVSFFD